MTLAANTNIVQLLLENGAKHEPSWFDYFYYNSSVYKQLETHSPEVANRGNITRCVLGSIAATAVFIPLAIYYLPGIAMYIGAGVLLCGALSVASLSYTNFHSKELQPNTSPERSNTLPVAVVVKNPSAPQQEFTISAALPVEKVVAVPSAPPIELQE